MGRKITSWVAILVLAPLLAGAGCGGGGNGPAGPQTLVVYPTPTLSGYVYEGGPAYGGVSTAANVGDNVVDRGIHLIRSFDLSGLPAGAQILSAVYEDEVRAVTGSPFATLGDIEATVTDVGLALDGSDYDGPAVAIVLGTLASDASLGVRTLDVTAAVATYAGGRLDVMLAFDDDSDDDGTVDTATLRTLSPSVERPTLTIEYSPY